MSTEVSALLGFIGFCGFVIIVSACFRAVYWLSDIHATLEKIRVQLESLANRHEEPQANDKAVTTEPKKPVVHVLAERVGKTTHPVYPAEVRGLYGKSHGS